MPRSRRLGEPKRLSEDERRALMVEQSALTALTKHPSWPTLIEVVAKKQTRLEREAIVRAFNAQGLDPVHAGYLRGFVEGMHYIVKVPEGAENRLEHHLRAQGMTNEGET